MSKSLTIGVPAESRAGEKRVALIPEDVNKLVAAGFQVVVARNAGVAAGFSNQEYKEIKGVRIDTSAKAWGADLVVHVQPPSAKEAGYMKKGSALISHVFAADNAAAIKAMKAAGIHSLAMELIPRITRAQAMDSLSSQATISGYWGVLHAAASARVFLPMITYAAGTIRPARVLVIGAGVAGLQAIATARRLGAVVEAFDVRPETREQIASLGAKAVDLGFDASGEGGYARELTKKEKIQVANVLGRTLAKADIVITTAGVPGRPSPKIITKEQVKGMQPGSLIVDLVAENGGNCELTKAGAVVDRQGVTISGPVNIPSRLPRHASQMYSKNLIGMIGLLIQNHRVVVESEDEVIQGCLLLKAGRAVHPSIGVDRAKRPAAGKTKAATAKRSAAKTAAKAPSAGRASTAKGIARSRIGKRPAQAASASAATARTKGSAGKKSATAAKAKTATKAPSAGRASKTRATRPVARSATVKPTTKPAMKPVIK